MANVIDIVIKASDQASGAIGKIGNSFKSITGFSLSAAGGIAFAGKAIDALNKFITTSISENEKYVTSIVDTARVLGMRTEETSRLVQASDDLFITQEKLNVALLAASRQGIDVSINGLKKLSSHYLSLSEGAERAQFVLKTFGRSGADMGKLMELGADGIDAATAAIADGLIVTEQSVEVVYAYKRAKDAASDAEAAFSYSIAQGTMPALTDLNLQYAETIEAINESGAATKTLSWLSEGLETALLGVKVIFSGYTTEAEIATKQNEEFSASQEIVTGNVKDTTQYFKDLTAEMIFNQLASTMDSDAQMQLAMQMGLINWETYSTITSIDELTTKYDTNADGVISLTEMTAEYRKELEAIKGYQNSLKDKTVTYTIRIREIGGSTSTSADQAHNQYIGLTGSNRAIGGYANAGTSYLVGERGPEIFTPSGGGQITPNNQIGGGGMSESQMTQFAKILGVAVATEIQKVSG